MKKRQLLLSLVLMLVFVFALTTGVAAKSKGKSKKVALNKTSASIAPGNTLKLKVKNSKEKATWKSSNTEIATVSRTGLVRAKKSGKATISAKVGKKTLKCKVTVKNVAKSVPLKGAKAVTTLYYVYKYNYTEKHDYTLDDYDFVPEKYKAQYEEDYNEYLDECKNRKVDPIVTISYIGPATLSLTDSCIMYQNFDTTINGYRGEHRYDIGITGSYSMPDEVNALIKTKEDWNYFVGEIDMSYHLFATNAPYNKGYAWNGYGAVGSILEELTRPATVAGEGRILNSCVVDRQAKTFSVNYTDLTQNDEATGASIELSGYLNSWSYPWDDIYDI